jgi:hypothetical protein
MENIILYNTEDGKASVKLYAKNNTVWLSQAQMGELFSISKSSISEHILHIQNKSIIQEIKNELVLNMLNMLNMFNNTLNGVFSHDLELDDPEVYMDAVGADLGETMGNIIAKSYQLMVELQPDAVLVLGDTNSCLSVIGAKRLHI